MKVLVVAPHPDDEAIGCGGSLCLHSDAGDRICVVFLTSGELGLDHLPPAEAWRVREGEAAEAAEIQGISQIDFLRLPDWTSCEHINEGADLLSAVLLRENPELIYVPHPAEWHPDHQAALPILLQALEKSKIETPELQAYEVWTPLGSYDCVDDITQTIRRKLAAVRCYRSQLTEFAYDRAVRGLNQYRGALAGRCAYAEVYQSIDLKD